MECVERHMGSTKKESVATEDALVTVIAANEVTGLIGLGKKYQMGTFTCWNLLQIRHSPCIAGVAIGMAVGNAIGVAVGIAVGMVVGNVVSVAVGFVFGIAVSMAVEDTVCTSVGMALGDTKPP
jgi:hypothetical protein